MSEPYWIPIGGSAVNPVRQILPVRLRVPRTATLAGNSFYSVLANTAWDAPVWGFIDAVEGRIYGWCRLPRTLSATPDPKLYLQLAATVAGSVRIQVKTALIGNGDSLNPASLPTTIGPQTVAIAAGQVINEVELVPTIAAAKTMLMEVTRFGADAADTLAGDMYLLDAILEVGP